MGLTSFKGKHPRKADIAVAKNYMTEDELFVLNRIVSAFFDLAELKARRHEHMHMRDWLIELDRFTDGYGEGTLLDAGSVSHEEGQQKAETEYTKYRQKIIDEFSIVEQDYLASIKETQKKLESKKKGGGGNV